MFFLFIIYLKYERSIKLFSCTIIPTMKTYWSQSDFEMKY